MSNKHLLIVLLIFPIMVFSQIEKDARLWTEVKLEKEVKDFTFNLGLAYRLDENFSHMDKALAEIEVEYKINKRWDIGIGYRYSRDNDYEDFNYDLKPRFEIGAQYDNKIEWWNIDDLKFKYRVKYQIESAPINENNEAYVRNKFTLDYKKKDWSPFISWEFYYQFNNRMDFTRSRISGGLKYDITKNTAIEIFYILEDKFRTDRIEQDHIYGIGYSIEF
ncbi:DUF2490 domain-containing protein [Brumimicrobium aurantiacum]|uniref:DUF2490 domain-containing protein n=1 Tax=Brumimicrobium aurantiacum TaxID=1737063 RepID=A0A3E1EV52_9FLAO|nr:DUF2490 domain-containing protein [Brumimicrobium aurantiacum]RFC53392.1 DUF2490 domain-containing protein [Brumimicrobium aurantiacum]